MDFNNSMLFKDSASILPSQYKNYNGLFILSIFKAGKKRTQNRGGFCNGKSAAQGQSLINSSSVKQELNGNVPLE